MVAEQIAARIAGLKLDQIRPSAQPRPKPRTEDDSQDSTLDKINQPQAFNEIDHADKKPLTRRFYNVMQQTLWNTKIRFVELIGGNRILEFGKTKKMT